MTTQILFPRIPDEPVTPDPNGGPLLADIVARLNAKGISVDRQIALRLAHAYLKAFHANDGARS